jgi:hypothetical protein
LPLQKTLIVCTPGWGICDVLSFYMISMVPSSAFITATGGERSPCEGFSLGETICFRSIEFIAYHFGGLSLSPFGDGSSAIVTGSTHDEPLLL